MKLEDNFFPVQSYYFFQSKGQDSISAFENVTKLKVNRSEVYVFPVSAIDNLASVSSNANKSWWNSFWEDGWSHITLGTVSTAFGIGFICLATGPVGWVSGILAIGGGVVSVVSGGGNLYTKDPDTKKLFSQLGDASLSLNNIPGLTVGAATYIVTGSYGQSIDYANYAGIFASGGALAKNSLNAFRMQRLYNLEVGLMSTKWSSRTRKINAMIMGINPKGLEGSHLIPQRVIKTLVVKAPKYKRQIENLANGPLGINFMTPIEHALVDPFRYQTLTAAQKAILTAEHPTRSLLITSYPKVAEVLGFFPNASPTMSPVFTSLAITGGRTVKANSTSK